MYLRWQLLKLTWIKWGSQIGIYSYSTLESKWLEFTTRKEPALSPSEESKSTIIQI